MEVKGKPLFPEDIAVMLTVFTKISFIIITFWYAVKIKIESGYAGLLALLTLLPIMPWISLIILLTRKPKLQENKK